MNLYLLTTSVPTVENANRGFTIAAHNLWQARKIAHALMQNERTVSPTFWLDKATSAITKIGRADESVLSPHALMVSFRYAA